MGISHSVILAVGKEFSDGDEGVIEFLKEKGIEIDEEELSDGLTELFYGEQYFDGVQCHIVDYYNGWGRVLGYDLSICNPELFAGNVYDAQRKFMRHFGEAGNIVCTVKIS
jgi:hypothetical protein